MKRIILFITLMLMALTSMAQYYDYSDLVPEEILAHETNYTNDYYEEMTQKYETYRTIFVVGSILYVIGTIAIVFAYFALCRNVKEILYHIRRRDGVRWNNGYFSPCRDDGSIIKSEE